MTRLYFTLLFVLAVCSGLAQVPALKPAQLKDEITVILGSKNKLADAEAMCNALKPNGVSCFVLTTPTPQGLRYRVCVGRFAQRAEAETAKKSLIEKTGIADPWLFKIPIEVVADTLQKQAPPKLVSVTPQAPPFDSTGFKNAYRSILYALASNNSLAVDAFINPIIGLHVIYNPGAHRIAEKVNVYADLLKLSILQSEDERKTLRTSLGEYATGLLRSGPLPEYDCAKEAFTHTGLFYKVLTETEKPLTPLMRSMKDLVMAEPLTPEELAQAQRLDAAIQVRVKHSDGLLVASLYFAKVEGRWYLAVLDLTVPCDA